MFKIGFRFEWCDSHALSVNTDRVPASELLWSLRKKVVNFKVYDVVHPEIVSQILPWHS